MSKAKRTVLPNLLLVAGLVILSIVMAACGADSEPTSAPVGLRPAAVDDLLAKDSVDVGETTNSILDDATGTAEDQLSEIESDPATTERQGNGGQARVADRSEHNFDPGATTEPSADEVAGLVYMREEEKLARDVYLTLYDLWGVPIFQNIAGSEQAHMDSVLLLLEQYGVADPAAGLGVGEFNDPFFQSLYEELVAQGSVSQIEALLVGAAIEELDIVDLRERLALANNEYIIQVYTNLQAGSENHLRSFVANLERQGVVYEPVYLDQDTYQAITTGAVERGNGNGGGYRGGNGSNGGNGNGRQNGRNNNA